MCVTCVGVHLRQVIDRCGNICMQETLPLKIMNCGILGSFSELECLCELSVKNLCMQNVICSCVYKSSV